MSIERELFSEQEERAKTALLTHKGANEEHIERFLHRWWEAKRPLIDAFGGLYLEGYLKEGESDEEEAEGSERAETGAAGIRTKLIREVGRWTQDTLLLCPFILVSMEKMPSRQKFFNHALSKLNLEVVMAEIMQSYPTDYSDEMLMMHERNGVAANTLVVANSDMAGSWSTLNTHTIPRHVKSEYRDELRETLRGGSIVESMIEKYNGCNVYRLLESIIRRTDIDKLLESKVNTGMKLSKFLKILYPEDMIMMQGWDEARAMSRGYWEQFDILWSQAIQEVKQPASKSGKPDVIVSLDPTDYLMMSEATSWQSCHQFKNNMMVTGGSAYAVDNCTAISYSPRDLMERHGIEFYDKKWRQVVHIDLDNGSAVFGREYPSAMPPIAKTSRRAVNYMLADHLGVPRKWWKAGGVGHINGSSSFLYAETQGPLTKLKDINILPSVRYGVSTLFCLACGGSMVPDEGGRKRLTCVNCKATRRRVTSDQHITVLMLSSACEAHREQREPTFSNLGSCCVCSDNHEFSRLLRVILHSSRPYHRRLICVDCLRENETNLRNFNIGMCEHCNQLFQLDQLMDIDGTISCAPCHTRVTGQFICDGCGMEEHEAEQYSTACDREHYCYDCYSNGDHVFECAGCGDVLPIEDRRDADHDGYCETCYEDIPFCDYCEEHVDGITYIERADRWVCSHCIEEYFFRCEECEELEGDDSFTIDRKSDDNRTWVVCQPCWESIQDENHEHENNQEEAS